MPMRAFMTAGDSRRYMPRHAERQVRVALADTRVVAVVGPRQSGKTTLVRRIAAADGRTFVSLDDKNARQFAASDISGFMRRQGEMAAIDEIQWEPEILLAIKKSVDENPRPGRYLITGSVDLFKRAFAPDSLAGRVEVFQLLPFSQAEIERRGVPAFLRRALAADFPASEPVGFTEDMPERILSGGYPEAFMREDGRRRQAWLRSYVDTLSWQDLSSAFLVGRKGRLPDLIAHAAAGAGRLVNLSSLATRLLVDHKTVDRWLTLLEMMFLACRVQAWHRNRSRRLVKAPKLHFLDPGVLAASRRISHESLGDRQELGRLLECLVFSEIAKSARLLDDPIAISHYRDKDGNEVDLVLESADATVGIEVKAAESVHPADFRGLRRLQQAAGERFSCGIVLHDGERIVRVGDRMFAMPVKMLWEA